jgi:hypothetical protein
VSLKSNANGTFAVDLKPDSYDVSVELWGFKKATRTSVKVAHKARTQVDFVLEIAPPVSPKIINPTAGQIVGRDTLVLNPTIQIRKIQRTP